MARRVRIRARAAVPHFLAHELRHNYAIRRLWTEEAGPTPPGHKRGLRALSLHLGHASVSTTEIYTRFLRNPPE